LITDNTENTDKI